VDGTNCAWVLRWRRKRRREGGTGYLPDRIVCPIDSCQGRAPDDGGVITRELVEVEELTHWRETRRKSGREEGG